MCKNTCKDTCKVTYKKIYGIVSAVLLGLMTFSCSQQPIFWAIAQEIKLLDPSIKGNVRSVVRCGDYLYAANGNVYRKHRTSERGWEQISKPEGNAVYLASSNSHIDTHVYALSAKGETVQVYVLNGNTWEKVSGASGKADEVVIFDNGDIRDERYAYVRASGKVFLLNGASLGTEKTGTNGAGAKTVAAARRGSDDYFSDTRAFCADGGKLYSIADDGKTIKWGTTNTDLSNTSVKTSETITCLVCDSVNHRLIAGTKKGLEEIKLDGSKNPISAGNLEGNAEAAFGESEILCVAVFHSSNGSNHAIYAGVGRPSSSKYNALWGYYSSRGNWNYE